jgi:protein gp37
MAETTKIAWTATVRPDGTVMPGASFSPWWGCQRISPGCGLGKSVGGCYAEAWAKRTGHAVWGPKAPRRFFGDKHWHEPRRWNAIARRDGYRRRVFCASMADVFEDRRDLDVWREKLWALIEETSSLDWLLLTKRPENMARLAPASWASGWPPNVWAGATAEDQRYYDERWAVLARVPAARRFISHEPALGGLLVRCAGCPRSLVDHAMSPSCPGFFPDWVITGGESGGGPRDYELGWADDLIAQTRGTTVALFVKQLGAAPVQDAYVPGSGVAYDPHSTSLLAKRRLKLVDKAGADPVEWPERLRVQESPTSAVGAAA